VQAETGLRELRSTVDTLITIPNQRLLSVVGKQTSLRDAFRICDDVLRQAVQGISDLITIPGLINLDFADVQTIMCEMGMALLGTGVARGENRAVEAAQKAISSPLLEESSIEGARGVLINITGGPDLTLFEVNEASSIIKEVAHEDSQIIFGAVIDDNMQAEIRVTVIATGFGYPKETTTNVPPVMPTRKKVVQPQPEPQPVASGSTGPTPTNGRRPAITERFRDRVSVSTLDEKSLEIPTFLRKRSQTS
jgi:cell division protein FtsZ